MNNLLITVAFYLATFSTLANYGSYIQVAVPGLFLVEAVRSYLSQTRHPNVAPWPPLIILIALIIPIASSFVALIRGNIESSAYGLIFCAFSVVIYMCLIQHGLAIIVRSYVTAMFLALFTILYFEHDSLLLTLAVTTSDTGLIRFAPFDTHPNIIGHVFGVFSCVCGGLILFKSKTHIKLAYLAALFFALTIVLAASSRGGLFAFIGSMVCITALEIKDRLGSFSRMFWLNASAGMITFILLVFNNLTLIEYVSEILQLDHVSRGIGTGLTGRVDAWPQVINILMNNISAFLFGFGFRSWDSAVMGFDIDNSYINLIYEIGILSTLTLVLSIVVALFRARHFSDSKDRIICSILLLFAMSEGIVIRHMIAIGNPASIFILFVIFYSLSNNKLSRISKPTIQ